jgi:formate dehydrogenase iron-sulfur subunit
VIGFAAASGFIHYLVKGPNRVSSEDENAAKRLTGERTP